MYVRSDNQKEIILHNVVMHIGMFCNGNFLYYRIQLVSDAALNCRHPLDRSLTPYYDYTNRIGLAAAIWGLDSDTDTLYFIVHDRDQLEKWFIIAAPHRQTLFFFGAARCICLKVLKVKRCSFTDFLANR